MSPIKVVRNQFQIIGAQAELHGYRVEGLPVDVAEILEQDLGAVDEMIGHVAHVVVYGHQMRRRIEILQFVADWSPNRSSWIARRDCGNRQPVRRH